MLMGPEGADRELAAGRARVIDLSVCAAVVVWLRGGCVLLVVLQQAQGGVKPAYLVNAVWHHTKTCRLGHKFTSCRAVCCDTQATTPSCHHQAGRVVAEWLARQAQGGGLACVIVSGLW